MNLPLSSKCDWVFVRNCVLQYINENAKRSAESILKLYIHFPLSFPVTSDASSTNKVKQNFYSPNVDYKENSKVSSEFLKPKCDSPNTE